ncbi:hypothetical protein EDD22DRAFT_914003 [Suillus occidentalis]|nr:hypothetical protein EDD22DRAFT_914003 [Suillus occidentalis]
MPAPVAVCVVAAIASVAAVIAFHEFVYEPHIAPAIERWAEDFLANRRARRRGPVPLQSTQGSVHGGPVPSGADLRQRTSAGEEDSIELRGFNLDEWRNQVHRTAPGTSMRRRVIPGTDQGSMSSTLDESFTSLTHTPLAPTHVISNVSSPLTGAHSLSTHTPSRAHSRATSRAAKEESEGDASSFFAPSPPFSAPPSPPFGPILPDTPRTSAAYSANPFSPVVRTPVRSRVPSSRSSVHHSTSSLNSRVSVDVQGRRERFDSNINNGVNANTSIVESLSERYPAPPTPPVMLSPPSSHTAFSSPSVDVLSVGSGDSCSGSGSGSPFDMVSPPVRIGEVHLSPRAASSLSPLMMGEHGFMVFGGTVGSDGDVVASRGTSARLRNPFTAGFDEGSDSDSGSEGSWKRVGTGRK